MKKWAVHRKNNGTHHTASKSPWYFFMYNIKNED